MELRIILLTVALVGCLPDLLGGPVKRYVLDDRRLYPVTIAVGVPTTILFPGAINALDAAGIALEPEADSAVLLSHTPGASFLTVRANRPDATGALNVIYRDRVYALTLSASENPDRTVTFVAASAEGSTRRRAGAERLLTLLDRAKEYAALSAQYPALVQGIEQSHPGTIGKVGTVSSVLEEILRFETEAALVFRVRLENHGSRDLHYDPARLAMKVGALSLPVALTDGSGSLPAGRSEIIRLVVLSPDDGRGAITLHNSFAVTLPLFE